MDADALGGLPYVLALLASRPHPDEVAAAIAQVPGSRYDVVSVRIFWLRGTTLQLIGLYGHPVHSNGHFQELDLSENVPVCRCVTEGAILTTPLTVARRVYAGDPEVERAWEDLMVNFPDGSVVTAPIVHLGVTIGAVAFIIPGAHTWTSLDLAAIEGICASLALWLVHPATGIPWPTSDDGAELTPRQAQVLELVASGLSTQEIASTLDYSPSTIKQELQRVMRMLGTSSRATSVQEARRLGLIPEGPGVPEVPDA